MNSKSNTVNAILLDTEALISKDKEIYAIV